MGAMRPPERPPFGRGAGRRARVPKYKGFAVHKKRNARGSPCTQNPIIKTHVWHPWSRPCCHLRGGNTNTNATSNMRQENENRAHVRGEMMRSDGKISAITSSTCNTRLQHGPSEGDSVWGPCAPPRDRPSGGARGGARACQNTKGLRFIKKKRMQGVPPAHTTPS